uniref:Transcription initiation factor TFIID subunit 8 n=1 Tax=Tetraselmis sp. GSL018 TaxID=582737 RepID=A0A061RDE3_9CHLO
MEEYSRAIARCAAAQISDAAGFEAVQESALDMVSELMLRFVSEIGAASHSYAELAGRTDTNVFDVLHALQELGMDLEQLRDHIDTEAENPFNHPLPSYPIQTAPPAFREKGEEPPEHVPAFLPAFPDERTYKETPVYASRNASREEIRRQQVRGRKDAGQALEKLSQRMAPRAPVNYAAAELSLRGGGTFRAAPRRTRTVESTPSWPPLSGRRASSREAMLRPRQETAGTRCRKLG